MKFAALSFLFLSFTSAVYANDHGPTRNLVSLAVSAKQDVASDLLVVQLFAEHESHDQAKASNQVNEDMAWALAAAKSAKAIKSQTLDYRSDPIYDEQKITGWRMHQGLRLTSSDHDALTALVGTLQQKLAIETVSYAVSDVVRDAVDEALIADAIKRFSLRAQKVVESFGRKGYTLVNVNIDNHGSTPPPMVFAGRAMTMKAEVASPSIEAGTQSVEVTVSGSIELQQ